MLLDRGVTLGTLLERAAAVHGDRQLVEESDDGLLLTYREAADLVARWAGAIREQISPGDRVVVATDNGYASVPPVPGDVAAPAAWPSPSTRRCSRRRSTTSSPTRRRRW